jgi:very-short-patch-repair endonuclease
MTNAGYYTQRQRARQLRKAMTDAERTLWQRVRGKQLREVQFYRQRPLGPFIADFWAPAIALVVEVDGSQHHDSEGRQRDERRNQWFQRQGIRVVRYDNRQVLTETDAVLAHLVGLIDSLRSHPPSPPSQAKGGKDWRGLE